MRPIGQIGERVMASQMFDTLLMTFPLGEVVDHADEILRRSVRVLHRQPGGGHNSRAIARGDDRVLAEKRGFTRSDQLLVFDFDLSRTGLRHDFGRSLTEHYGPFDAQDIFRRHG